MMRPILLNSCARAATAAEARFRIDAPIAPNRGTRVVALDDGAAAVIRRVAGQHWARARFFTFSGAAPSGAAPELLLRGVDGALSRLSVELRGADVAVMVATAGDGAEAAHAIGDACASRGIMTAGLVLGFPNDVRATVSALRPYARVLMVTQDEHDVSEVLSALRA